MTDNGRLYISSYFKTNRVHSNICHAKLVIKQFPLTALMKQLLQTEKLGLHCSPSSEPALLSVCTSTEPERSGNRLMGGGEGGRRLMGGGEGGRRLMGGGEGGRRLMGGGEGGREEVNGRW